MNLERKRKGERKMHILTKERLDYLSENGYTVLFFRHYALVRKYSRFCSSNWFKRHCPFYHLVKIG